MRHALFFFGLPTIALISFHYVVWNISYGSFNWLTIPILFFGLILLGIGYFMKGVKKHFIRFLGWLIFAIYWTSQPEYLYYKGDGDIVNAIFCIVGVYFLSYISYHEYLSYKRGEEISSLKFLAGATFMAGIIYFLIQKIDFLSGFLIKTVAEQTVWILKAFNYPVKAGGIEYGMNVYVPIYYDGEQTVQIILACTGLQSMAVFIGVFFAVNADLNRKLKAFLITVPTIYMLNLIRNVGVIYGMEELGLSFYTMHNVIGKLGSLIALIILAFIVFDILPELYDEIVGLFNLPKRRGPIERMFIR